MPQLQHAKPTIRNRPSEKPFKIFSFSISLARKPTTSAICFQQNCKTYGLDILKPISYTLLTPYHSKIKIKISPQCINERHIHDMSFVFAL